MLETVQLLSNPIDRTLAKHAAKRSCSTEKENDREEEGEGGEGGKKDQERKSKGLKKGRGKNGR